MRGFWFASIMAASAAACSAAGEAGAPAGLAAPSLEPLWVAEGFDSPESAVEAPGGGYFVSSVAGEGGAKDGDGWISLISADGEMLAARFAEGLDAPKGLAVLDGVLYAADIDRVRMIDAATGASKGEIVLEGAQFLNDATVWNGAVYVSDSRTASIFRIAGSEGALWLQDDRLVRVNGLLGAQSKMYIVTMESGALYEANARGDLKEIASGLLTADGVGAVKGGGWLVSIVPGEIVYVSPDGETAKLLDTRDKGISQNDLNVFGDIAVVANWRVNTVTAWRVLR